ncbi:hypothetical protein HOD29_04245 [archaeon]|nr:hypothetical protein [archaeon]
MQYKAYSFDLDDNLLTLPTKIILKTSEGKLKKFSTKDFEILRPNLKKSPYEVIASSFDAFQSDSQLLKDIAKSEKAGSWQNLVNCVVHHTSIFAIITARRHSIKALREGLKQAIIKNLTKSQLEEFSKKFQEKYKLEANSTEESLDKYLDLCHFYPLNNPEMQKSLGSTNTEELKALAFQDFQVKIKQYVKNKFGEKTKVTIGFSDDSISHLKKVINEILKSHGLFFYQTTSKGKHNLAFS